MYVAFFIYKIVRMVEKLDVTFYESFGYDGDIPSVVLSKEIFGGGIGVIDGSGAGGMQHAETGTGGRGRF